MNTPLLQSAQSISMGYKNKRANRSLLVQSPKADVLLVYWAILPGKTNTKNNAVAIPSYCFCLEKKIRDSPRPISTTPEKTITKSPFSGIHFGT